MLLRVKIAGVNGENLAKVALTKYWYLPYDMKNIYVAAKKYRYQYRCPMESNKILTEFYF